MTADPCGYPCVRDHCEDCREATDLPIVGGGTEDYRVEDEEPVFRFPAHKDKARWCKGKVGREHEPVTVLDRHMPERLRGSCDQSRIWGCQSQVECAKCGKVLVHSFQMHRRGLCPEGVTEE